MKTKLCIFDLDGTLLNTIDDITNSMNRVLGANGYPLHDAQWYKEKVGNGARKLMLDALPEDHNLSDADVDKLLNTYKDDYHNNCAVLSAPYAGIPELIDRLVEAKLKLAVITNKPQSITETLLKKYFEGIDFVAVYGDTPGKPIKPDPRVADIVLSAAGVTPDQTVFIGDSEVDMTFAKRSSLFAIGVLWGYRNRSIIEESGAEVIVDEPAQIIEYI